MSNENEAGPEEKVRFLKAVSWFQEASDELLTSLAEVMDVENVQDGHIFVEEGQIIDRFLIIESGELSRTKTSIEKKPSGSVAESLRSMNLSERKRSILEDSVLVDKIRGRGHVTGILHVQEEGTKAYATISANGPARIWSIKGDDFRRVISESPAFCLEHMRAMSKELRHGTKSFRALIEKERSRSGVDKSDGNGKTCRILCYDSTSWVHDGFQPAIEAFNSRQKDGYKIVLEYTSERLNETSATYAVGFDGVCLFVNDTANSSVLRTLSLMGVGMIALRCAGFDRVDIKAAKTFGITVSRVPAYSPYAVAEMAVALLMSVNRKIPKANNRVKMANFSLDTGLLGMDINGKTVGVMGTGKIGQIVCRIMNGFGAKLLCYDVFPNDEVKEMGGAYVSKDELFAKSDVIFLMMPLLEATHHTINHEVLPKLKRGVILINTSRGGLVDTSAVLDGLHTGVIGGLGMDVYENEQEYFFQDWSGKAIRDKNLESLLGNNNVIMTAHQAFFTNEALSKIVSATIENIRLFSQDGQLLMDHPNNCLQ